MQGIQPSYHDAVEDYAIVFNAKDMVMGDDMGQAADVLLFLASMDTVIGGKKTIDNFETWFGNWWKDPTITKDRTFKVRGSAPFGHCLLRSGVLVSQSLRDCIAMQAILLRYVN